ncbi:YbaK/EbsC family protein, partial [Enterococcus faecalis]
GLAHDPEVYLDVSLKRFQTVFPACGSRNSAIELTPKELSEFSFSKVWIDVCKDWE